ncbi:MAG: glycoside hydrolase family 97 N-terminal domain-containing protein, partial [Thermoplasmatota archaeon]
MDTPGRENSALRRRGTASRVPLTVILSLTLLLVSGILPLHQASGDQGSTGMLIEDERKPRDRSEGPSVLSPDGRIGLDLYVDDSGLQSDCILYDLIIDDDPIITNSTLGLTFGGGIRAFGSSVTMNVKSKGSINGTYNITNGYRDEYTERYNYLVLQLNETVSPYRSMILETRVYDEGAAIRYRIGENGWPASLTISGELTGFKFAEDHDCYTEYGTEGTYTLESITKVQSKCESPLTVDLDDGGYISITEGNTTDYSRMYLNR